MAWQGPLAQDLLLSAPQVEVTSVVRILCLRRGELARDSRGRESVPVEPATLRAWQPTVEASSRQQHRLAGMSRLVRLPVSAGSTCRK